MSTLFLLESINEYRTGYIETIATEYGQPNTSQTYGCPADPNNLWHLNCFSGCGGTRSKPATIQEIVNWGLNRNFTYVVITGGFYSSYKTEVDDYISRGGKVYKLTSKSGCSGPDCHCYYISFNQIILCTPNWQCEQPLNSWEHDGCGNRRQRTDGSCNPCIPNWECEQPLNRYEKDGCGNRRLNSVCNPCIQNWICEIPLNGYEKDGCGNRRTNPLCNPCISNWQCEQPLNGYEKDGCGNRRTNILCNPCPDINVILTIFG